MLMKAALAIAGISHQPPQPPNSMEGAMERLANNRPKITQIKCQLPPMLVKTMVQAANRVMILVLVLE